MGTYLRPHDVGETFKALHDGAPRGPWTVVAGATDHYPARVGRLPDEDILDITAIAAFRGVRAVEEGWWIGGLTTWTDLAESHLPPLFDGLRRAARTIGGLQVQNRATIAGNVCNASPAADGIPNLIALDAEVELTSAAGIRRMPISRFVTGNRRTERRPDELLTGFVIPGTAETGRRSKSTFLKLGTRAYLVISIAMVAAVLEVADGATIARARIAVGACSEVARRLPELESHLVGVPLPDASSIPTDAHLAGLTPIDDVRGTAAYRREAALVLVRRALAELAS